MCNSKQKKWKFLLAAVLLATGISGVCALPSYAASYTTGLDGDVNDDRDVIGGDGNTVRRNGNTITYDFGGQDHTFTVRNQDVINFNGTTGTSYDYVVNNVKAGGSYATLTLDQRNTRANDFMDVNGINVSNGRAVFNTNLAITAYSAYASVGVGAGGGAQVVLNGDVTMRKADPASPWGIITNNVHGNVGPGGATQMEGSENYTGARWQPGAFSIGYTGGSITANGNVDVAVRGTAVQTNAYSALPGVSPYDAAVISLNGPSTRIDTPDNEVDSQGHFKEGYYALASYGGTINVNVKDGAAGTGRVNMVGNVIAMKRSARTDKPDVYQNGRLNIGLTTGDSTWKGVIDNAGAAQAGEVNVWLQNGAQWNHEAASKVNGLDYEDMPTYSKPSYETYDGVSYVNAFHGGNTESAAGFISQNHDSKIDIQNYSGHANVIYRHTGDGTDVSNYIGGDTVIHHAAAGSGITLVTSGQGVSRETDKVLNALAQKLTYTAFADAANPESNLTGKVVIASGLTASSYTADVSGLITFDPATGKGGYKRPAQGEQTANVISTGITGDRYTDTAYVDANILRDDGTYRFTITPSTVQVAGDTDAVHAESQDVTIQAENGTLNLHAEQGSGIRALHGRKVSANARKLDVTGRTGIYASGNDTVVESVGNTDITGTQAAIHAENGAAVTVGNGILTGDVVSDGGRVVVNPEGKSLSSLAGNILTAHGGSVDLTVAGAGASFDGDVAAYADSETPAASARLPAAGTETAGGDQVKLTVADGASWTGGLKNPSASLALTLSGGTWNQNNKDGDTELASLAGGSGTVTTFRYVEPSGGQNVERTIPVNGFIRMEDGAKGVTVGDYSGTHIVSYAHQNDGAAVSDYNAGDFRVTRAAPGAMVIAATDNKGIRVSDKNAVDDTLSALAQKFYYANAGTDTNLSGKAMIASGLTSSSVARWIGNMGFDADRNGIGTYDPGSTVNVAGDYETAIMKGARAAMTSALLSWRNNAADLIYRGDLLRTHMVDDGIWARTYGGRDTFDRSGIGIRNNYWGTQVGYDKVYSNDWIAGAAIDYQDGDSDYSYSDEDFGRVHGSQGRNKLYSFGLYGSKDLGGRAHFDITAKAGSVSNDFDLYNGISDKVSGKFRSRAYSVASRVGKRFGDDRRYIEPQLQLTYAHVDARDYNASNDDAVLHIGQGSYDSTVGRIGVEAGLIGKHGTLFGRVGVNHEFNGDVKGTYYAEDGGEKKTSQSMQETWVEMGIGSTLQITDTGTAYLDIARTFGADYEQKWKINGGVRFALGTGVVPGKKEAAVLPVTGLAPASEEAARDNQQTTGTTPKPQHDASYIAPAAAAAGAAEAPAAAPAEDAGVTYSVSHDVTASSSDPDNMMFTLGPVVVTANRITQPILEAKADISVVSRKEIETMNMGNVEEALRTVPGVQFLNYGANGLNANLSSVRINGSNNIVLLVDGVRVNDFQGGTGSSSYMFASLLNNMDNVERVEVLRGAASVMYGSSAQGGVINIITRKPRKNQTTLDISRGSFERENYRINTQGVKGKLSYNIYSDKSISGDMKDGSGRRWDGHTNTNSNGIKASYDFNDAHTFTVNYDHSRSNFEGTDLIYNGHYVGNFETNSYMLKHDWHMNDKWSNTLVYRHNNEKWLWSKPGGEDPDMKIPITNDTTYELYSEQFRFDTKRHAIVGGIEYSKGKDNHNGKNTDDLSYYIQDDWKILPTVTLSGGVRRDSPKDMDDHNSFSYKLSWDFTKKDSIYAGRSDYYILPSLTQMYDARFGNDKLKPAEGRTTSIGYNHEFSPNTFFTFNWFETKAKVGQTINDNGQYVNYQHGIVRGWNAQFNTQFAKYWSARLGWAHLYYDDSGSFGMGYAPKNKATFSLYYDRDKVSAGLDGFYFIRDTRNAKPGVKGWPSDKYGVFNFSLNYAANENTTFYMKVENLFNKLWAEHTDVIWNGGTDRWYAMPGRTLIMGMKLKF